MLNDKRKCFTCKHAHIVLNAEFQTRHPETCLVCQIQKNEANDNERGLTSFVEKCDEQRWRGRERQRDKKSCSIFLILQLFCFFLLGKTLRFLPIFLQNLGFLLLQCKFRVSSQLLLRPSKSKFTPSFFVLRSSFLVFFVFCPKLGLCSVCFFFFCEQFGFLLLLLLLLQRRTEEQIERE